jgi:hypothetical protein
MTTRYSIFHPDGFYMCDIEIRNDDSAFNKAQVNEPGSATYNPKLPRWERTQPTTPASLGQELDK